MNAKSRHIYTLAVSAVLGAAYAVLTMLLAPISYGAIQFRASEALCILPFFIPGSCLGAFCRLRHSESAHGESIRYYFRLPGHAGRRPSDGGYRQAGAQYFKLRSGMLYAVLFNALVVGAVITCAYNGMGLFSHFGVFALNAAQVGLGEAAVLYLIGLPLMRWLPGKKFFREFIEKTKS